MKKLSNNKKEFMSNVINHNLFIQSARILEQNFVPYIDRADLTQIVIKKVQFEKYLDEKAYDYDCVPANTFSYHNKNPNLSFDKGVITIKTDKVFDADVFNKLSPAISYNKATGIKINTNDIVYVKEIDHTNSIKNMADLCHKLNIKPLKIFIINNILYIYDYDVQQITLDEVKSIRN